MTACSTSAGAPASARGSSSACTVCICRARWTIRGLKPVTVAGSTEGLAVDLLMAWNPRRDSPARDRFIEVVRAVVA
jgi:hypothetical protein